MREKYFNINKPVGSIRCKAYLSDPRSVSRVIVYGHGFSGHRDNKAAQRFADYVLKKHRDVAVITFDLPCHGDDVKKKLSLTDCDGYIGAVAEYAKAQYGTDDVSVYATSFGGYLILKYIYEHGNPFRKIALRCPAVNMYKVLSDTIMEPDELKALSRNKPIEVGFDRKIKITKAFLDELKNADIGGLDYRDAADDILIVHGTRDEVVSFDYVREFAEKNDIKFVSVENADHRFKAPTKMDEAIKSIYEFIFE